MRILFLAPQPFFQERGTPLAVDRVLQVLSRRGRYKVDVVTYHEGADVEYPNVALHRIPSLPFVRDIAPGFSFKKLLCDFIMIFKVLALLRTRKYELVHAVEEAVYIAFLLKKVLNIPYVYDMDSSLAEQMVEKHPALQPFLRLLRHFEQLAITNATTVVPVCEVLAEAIVLPKNGHVTVIPDVSLLQTNSSHAVEDLRQSLALEGIVLMYVGNLEAYQGMDLLLQAFQLAIQKVDHLRLVVIGGKESHIQKYVARSRDLKIDGAVHFVGPRPVEQLASYLAQADILLSPRIKGKNTPMKLFSYLDSGKPVVATNLLTHTQVVNMEVAMLADPLPGAFAEAIVRLARDGELRKQLGRAGKQLVQERHSYAAFSQALIKLFENLETVILPHPGERVTGNGGEAIVHGSLPDVPLLEQVPLEPAE